MLNRKGGGDYCIEIVVLLAFSVPYSESTTVTVLYAVSVDDPSAFPTTIVVNVLAANQARPCI